MEITENIIRGSIVKQLKDEYPDITVYDERIDEGFIYPSFHVLRVDDIFVKGYTGKEYSRNKDNYRYTIKYFTDQKDHIIEDINNKIDKLKEIFRYLNIVNIVEDGFESKTNRINGYTIEVVDDVLIFQIRFDIDTIILSPKNKVQENIITLETK